MAITYILNIIWILTFCFLCIITFVYTIFWKMCSQKIEEQPRRCQIDLAQFRKYHSSYLLVLNAYLMWLKQIKIICFFFFNQISYFRMAHATKIWKYAKNSKSKHFAKMALKKLKWCSFWPHSRACLSFSVWYIIWFVCQQIMRTFEIMRNSKSYKRYKIWMTWNTVQRRKIDSNYLTTFHRSAARLHFITFQAN